MKPKVSATVICKNEAHNIEDCLKSLSWCDEIVVVDSGSTDATVELARKHTPKVMFHEWPGYIPQKNFALGEATGDWIISLDADERCTPELHAELVKALATADQNLAGFEVRRHVKYLGRWIDHCGWYPDWKLRVVRRGKARWGGVEPHDKLLPEGPVQRIKADIHHFTYKDFSHHIRIINHFSDVVSAQYVQAGRKPSIFQAIFHPPWKFLEVYLFRLGFLDGFPGFVIAAGSAFFILARYVKLWESGKQGEVNVSVVVVNFNGGDITPACLQSIPPGVETIVIDNGSKDGSPDAIAEKFPSVTLLRYAVNLGFARAVNQGIARSTGRYVCLLNNDARLSPDTLSTLAAYMDAHPDVGITAPQLLHEDGRKQHSFDNFPSLATVFLNKSLLRLLAPGRYPSKKQEFAEPREVESVIGACMMVRRELIERIGPLDESFFLFLEETDWCLRARRAGSKVVFVPSSRVVHLQGKTRDKARVRGRIEYTRSLFAYFRKNRPASSFLLRLFFPLRNAIEFVFQTLGIFLPNVRRRWVETGAVLGWQLCFCPRDWGLSRAIDTKVVTLRDGTRVDEAYVEAFNDFDSKRRATKVLKDLNWKKTLEYTAGGRTYFIKIYKAPGWWRRLRTLLIGSRASHEWAMSDGVYHRGIRQAPVVAMREGGGEDWVAIEKLEGWSQLQQTLLASSDRRRLCAAYGRFARRVHDAGISQYDFNPTNVLVKDAEFRIIDFERMKLHSRAVSPAKRLRSLAKMNRVPTISRTDRLRFLKGYLASSASESAAWKDIAREILRLHALQVDHDVDRSERRCLDENRDFGAFDLGEWHGYYRKKRNDRTGGVTLDEVRALTEGSPESYRFEPAGDAITEWQKANRRAKEGGPMPVAVIVKRSSSEGKIAFPKA